MKIKSIIFISLIYLSNWQVSAQVATPSLSPSAQILNPALSSLRKAPAVSLHWTSPLSPTLETADGSQLDTSKSDYQQTDNYLNGNYKFKEFGAELYFKPKSEDVNSKISYTSGDSSEVKLEEEQTTVNLGYLVYEFLALGIKSDSINFAAESSLTNGGNTTKSQFEQKQSSLGLGMSLRVFNFFLAYSLEKVTHTPQVGEDRKFDYNYFGGGFSYGHPRNFEVRAEISQRVSEKDLNDDVKERKVTYTALELQYRNFYFGYLKEDMNTVEETNNTETTEEDKTDKISLGIINPRGFFFELNYLEGKTNQSNIDTKFSTAGLSLGYIF